MRRLVPELKSERFFPMISESLRLYYLGVKCARKEGRGHRESGWMDTRENALKLYREFIPKLLECGTEIDEHYRRFRELRLMEDDLSFQSALLNVEHAFFMVVQSMNILRENLKLLETAVKKKEIE